MTPIPYQAALNTGASHLSYLMKITRTDGYVVGMTSADESVTRDGVFYDAENGIDVSDIATSEGLNVDNLELTTADDGTLFTRNAVLGGIWQNAAFVLSRYDRTNIGAGLESLLAGTFGQVWFRAGAIVCELRGLQQYLQQEVGNLTSRTCRARFADYPTPNANNRCRLDPTAYIVEATVSAVTSRQVFTSAALWAAKPIVDWFGEGLLTWTTGPKAGMRMKVKSYVASGVVTLMLPAVDAISIGDEFEVIAGCRKRLAEDCKTKFNNVLNFQGEPHLPGIDALTASADVSA